MKIRNLAEKITIKYYVIAYKVSADNDLFYLIDLTPKVGLDLKYAIKFKTSVEAKMYLDYFKLDNLYKVVPIYDK